MSKPESWQNRISDLVDRAWNMETIRKRLEDLRRNGFGSKEIDWTAMQANRLEVLDRVQLRAEEYEYLTHSCSKGSALALMEEFGLGNWTIVRAMSPFPGFGMTGGICGGVTGSLVALGLFFGSDDPELSGAPRSAVGFSWAPENPVTTPPKALSDEVDAAAS